MTNTFNLDDLVRLAKDVLAKQKNGQEFTLSNVYGAVCKAYDKHSEDPVIRQFAFVIERMFEKRGPTAIINQRELTDIYNNFVRLSENSRFREVLGSFVFDAPIKTASENSFVSMNRVDACDAGQIDSGLDANSKELVNLLDNMFDNSLVENKAFNDADAAKGAEYVSAELSSFGLKNASVKILGGNKNAIVYAAQFDTLKGLVSVAIPIETTGGKLRLPSVFVNDVGFEKLNSSNLQGFINKKADTNDFSVPSAGAILKAIGTIMYAEDTAGVVQKFAQEKQELYVSSSEQHNDLNANSDPSKFIAADQKVEMPKELTHLAQDFENTILEAASTFGKAAVVAGKKMVLAELISAGFKNAQVRFGSESSESVIYIATINTPRGVTEIEVPVEMTTTANDTCRPLSPAVFAFDGLVEDFTAAKLQRFAISRMAPSSGQMVCSTEHTYMTLPELKDEIIKSASENDYSTCEMILGTVQERFDESAYKNCVADYHYLLMLKNRQAVSQRKCTREIPAGKGSIECRCGHLGVPMSRVVIGEDGLCRLKTAVERERLNPVSESGAAISSSKIVIS